MCEPAEAVRSSKGLRLTSSRVAPSDREGPGWVPGRRLELADHLVVVRSWLLHEPDLGLAKDDGAARLEGNAPAGESAVSVRARIANLGVAERYCVIPFLLPPPKNPCPQGPRKLPKLDVAGSTPVARSREFEDLARCC